MFRNILTFGELTRTAKEAADQIGCSVSQIAKSIIFKTVGGEAVLVITSGSNRVDEQIIENELGQKILKADADFVKDKTGFVIGGVPPWGHKEKIVTFIDEDLKKYDKVWASAGKNNAVFETNFEELVKESSGKSIPIN